MLGRRIAARLPPPTRLTELRRALLDEWCNIPQDQIDNLILSIPRHFVLDETKQLYCGYVTVGCRRPRLPMTEIRNHDLWIRKHAVLWYATRQK
ncbi:hypothetical protein TNCV_2350341 [Trichonephila clavipes]|uniref:Uncharacterized protein n=1 Tax=Trichonephila clavipes TaxID=2585209 RepID=A0A8X6SMV4_TRICX|nr:hypothetical protein TNCV_2350341 [Trichonephila clavipes]